MQREEIATAIVKWLQHNSAHLEDVTLKRAFYIYGDTGIGKTHFIQTLLEQLGYDVLKYDTDATRNNHLLEEVLCNHNLKQNVHASMYGNRKPIAIFIDNVEALNVGKPNTLTSLTTVLRTKKTKKQSMEKSTRLPVFCAGGMQFDKNMVEFIKSCHVYRLPPLGRDVQLGLARMWLGGDGDRDGGGVEVERLVDNCKNDLRQLKQLCRMVQWHGVSFLTHLRPKYSNLDMKTRVSQLLSGTDTDADAKEDVDADPFTKCVRRVRSLGEAERTVLGLLLHENLPIAYSARVVTADPDTASNTEQMYAHQQRVMCFADVCDTVSFLHHVPILSEWTAYLKIGYVMELYSHPLASRLQLQPEQVQFTKTVTRTATEHANATHIMEMCFRMNKTRTALLALFSKMQARRLPPSSTEWKQWKAELEKQQVGANDIQRMFRYLERCTTGLSKETVAQVQHALRYTYTHSADQPAYDAPHTRTHALPHTRTLDHVNANAVKSRKTDKKKSRVMDETENENEGEGGDEKTERVRLLDGTEVLVGTLNEIELEELSAEMALRLGVDNEMEDSDGFALELAEME